MTLNFHSSTLLSRKSWIWVFISNSPSRISSLYSIVITVSIAENNDTKIKTTWVSSKQSFKHLQANLFPDSSRQNDRYAENRFQSEIKLKEAISVQLQHGLFYLLYQLPSQRFKIQKLSISALIWTLISFILKKFRHFPIREMFSRSSWGKRLR